ncbi:YcaO-like family protein [Aquirufa ecclesiirivi]|uniref:YcaO-like family protein n=1 Tax=Aquirufa ecclesiirivi TaxID=2715124 RepID=A0ABT4JGN8_9BACT|nr:YcaO-like family protein [Aquirufa ecclesiirivi]MCZ2475446.1 YcaO-like family protein [Aquirufa ecclesiirivi]
MVPLKHDLIHGNRYQIPTRRCLPLGLYQSYVEAAHLDILASNTHMIQGSGIGFSQIEADNSAIGEWIERYAASHQHPKDFIFASETDLRNQGKIFLPVETCIPFIPAQYDSNFPYQTWQKDDVLSWIESKNILNQESVWVPAFTVHLPHNTEWDQKKNFILQTSTGIAAGKNMQDATVGGFLECAERNAFAEFWYRQDHWIKRIPIMNQQDVLTTYRHPKIKQLFDNTRVQIKLFDLSVLSSIETHVVVLFFPYKGQLFQSMGCASRFMKEDSIIKACLEAYQGVEYAIGLSQKPEDWIQNMPEFENINSFDKHFAFYNRFPQWRKKSPILQAALSPESYFPDQEIGSNKIHSWDEVNQLNIGQILVVPISTEDVQSQGFEVVRVIVPNWNLLTGVHSQPFLKYLKAQSSENLFLSYPHPFP